MSEHSSVDHHVSNREAIILIVHVYMCDMPVQSKDFASFRAVNSLYDLDHVHVNCLACCGFPT
jgi:hypothetical protein